jgi:hypothetical protein
MNAIILGWLFIGSVVNLFIHYRNADKFGTALMGGQLNILVFLLMGFTNHILWPLALYTELTRKL